MPRKRAGAIVETDQTVCGRMEHGKAFAASRIGLALFLVSFALCVAWTPAAAAADTKIKNKVAVFAALDKVTGRISHLEIPIDKTVEFGALKVTPRVCDTRPPTEQPNTASFVEVDEVKLTGEEQRLFTGWMFAASPGINAVEHPIYDVWLTECKGATPAVTAEAPSEPTPTAQQPPRPQQQRQPQQPRRAAPVVRPAVAPAPATNTISVTRGVETKDYEVGGYAQ